MKFAVSLAAALAFSGPVFAQNWTTIDPYSGNVYMNSRDSHGTTTMGLSNNGSTWRLRQNRDGSYNGTDSNGNVFIGDHNSGFYMNSGTGVTCIGTGYARTCY